MRRAFSLNFCISPSAWGPENFLKNRSPASKRSTPFSFSVTSLTQVPLLARPPKRVVGPQTGQGSISPLILLVYRSVMEVGELSAPEGRSLTKNRSSPKTKTVMRNHLFIIFIPLIVGPHYNGLGSYMTLTDFFEKSLYLILNHISDLSEKIN